jgi:hypothetical protein
LFASRTTSFARGFFVWRYQAIWQARS